jgi:thymidylate synthase (FAD)
MKIDLFGDGIGHVSLVDHVGTDKSVVNSARVSFGQDNDLDLTNRDKKLIKYLIKHRHTSTLEHNVATFMFEVPLFIRAQHMRHRTWSYNEISRRYTEVDMKFYVPQGFRTQHESNRQASKNDLIDPIINNDLPDFVASDLVKMHHRDSLRLFEKLIASGVCREQARGVLPQNLYTRYYGTVNLNNLLKFIDLRMHEGAQWEIQQVAKACLEIATELWPFTVGAYRESRHEV